MGTPVAVAASGNSSSTTQSGISGGTIVIRDEAGQLALTGKTAAETIGSLSRDTTDTLNALKLIFDKEKIEAGFEIASEAQRQMGQFLTNRAKETQDAKARSEDKSLSYAERAKAAQEYADLESKWGAQGSYSQWGTVIVGAASGNVMGGTGQFIQAATVNYLQTLGAAKIKEISGALGGEGSVGHAALHAVLGCAGAAAQGASCGAGGAGALSGVVLSKLLDSIDDVNRKKLTPEEEQARANLISSIVAGIAASIDPTAAVPAEVAARIEVENNSRYKNLDKVARMKAEVTAKAIATCADDNSCLQAEFDRADKMAAAYDVALTLSHYPQLSKEKADTLAQAVLDLAPGVSNASALYELLTGKTATGDEANRYFAAIGLVPVLGGIIKKGGQAVHVFAEADKAVDAAKVGGQVGVGGAKATGGAVDRATTGIEWGKGIQGQGMPWEDYLGTQLPAGSRLPPNFKTFDFFDETTGIATSAKTLDTTTAAKIANPNQVYSSLKGNIDAAANFSESGLKGVTVTSSQITARELQVAIPEATTSAQWEQINRAIEYGQSKGITVKITKVN